MANSIGFLKVEFFDDGSSMVSHELDAFCAKNSLILSQVVKGIEFSVSIGIKEKNEQSKQKDPDELMERIIHALAGIDKPISSICQRAKNKTYTRLDVAQMVKKMTADGILKTVEISHPKKGTLIRYAVA